jgi:hypothetical protein
MSASRTSKRRRIEDDEADRSTPARLRYDPTDLTNRPLLTESAIKRWVWLEIAVLPANKEPEMNPAFNRYHIPEAVIDSIPDYQVQLFDELAAIEAEGGEEPVVRDNCPRDPKNCHQSHTIPH